MVRLQSLAWFKRGLGLKSLKGTGFEEFEEFGGTGLEELGESLKSLNNLKGDGFEELKDLSAVGALAPQTP